MPCDDHENLNQDWQEKFRAEISVHDGYGKSIKATLAERSRTDSDRINAETRLVDNIKGCAVCKSEGREPREVDHHQPSY